MQDRAATAGLPADDLVLPFMIEQTGVRGRLLRMGAAVDTIVTRPGYPRPVAALLGELVALCAALGSTLKYDGVFTLQIKGDGPIRTMVADMTSAGDLRGYAGFDAEAVGKLEAEGHDTREIGDWLGEGYLAFTVDQGPNTQRYQGIVELTGPRLADGLLHYFRQSQQLNAGVVVAVERTAGGEAGGWRAGAILIESIPDSGGSAPGTVDEEGWRRANVLAASCTDAELLDPALAPERLLYRLFHEDGVRVFETRPVAVGCRCSREKVENILRSLPRDQVEDCMVEGAVVMTCEFCSIDYRFDGEELDALLRAAEAAGGDAASGDETAGKA